MATILPPTRIGCVTFEERVTKLIATNQIGNEEWNTWLSVFGKERLDAIQAKFKEGQKPLPVDTERTPDEDGWILVHPDEFDVLRAEDVLEYGSSVLPGGAIYVRLKK